MAQTVFIALTIAGTDTGPFDLYSDADAYFTPFEIGVPKSSLLSGYTSTLVPNAATIIRVQSTSVLCTNYVDLPIITSSTTTTTSTSTSSTSTTTSTTTTPLMVNCIVVSKISETEGSDCFVRASADFPVASSVTVNFTVFTNFSSYTNNITIGIGNTLSSSFKVIYGGTHPTEVETGIVINTIMPSSDATYIYSNCI